MATSLTSESWKLFAVLLVVSSATTFVLSAVFDALALRTLRRRADPRPTWVGAAEAPRRPDRIPVHQ
ncbi:hypothetical protein [Streptomyces sp. SAI-090]|uniref:hypothetical protein n=1 Tax=Streptomyces sp. SAI-090 TaxID=2940545 RepID=UPI0024768D76|nr:hypothetical protein [Streptomyces sp. SAI-090]MDH6522176.1 uncharacterized PurR-regulated membrane protein YhhQ (DUF165 family) [Streptomyces sp. SAI-090]